MTGPPARRAPRPSVCVVVGDEDERRRLGRRPITHRYSIVDIRRARRLDGKLFPTPWRAPRARSQSESDELMELAAPARAARGRGSRGRRADSQFASAYATTKTGGTTLL